MKRLRNHVEHEPTCKFHWGEDCSCWNEWQLEPSDILLIVYVAVLIGLFIIKIH